MVNQKPNHRGSYIKNNRYYYITRVGGKYWKSVKSHILIGLKLRHRGKYTPVFPATNSYGKMVANVDVKSKGTSSFTHTDTDSKKFFSVSEQKKKS